VKALERPWHVLLIGGASGIGKTTLANQLGQRFGVNVTQLDDIQTALEAVTTLAHTLGRVQRLQRRPARAALRGRIAERLRARH
jgi:Holliday junction resolvasome RuvABC ATP-dependent DNA helicase subunit